MSADERDFDPFPEPLSIAELRAGHAAHVVPEFDGADALVRLSDLSTDYGHDAATMRVKADGSATLGCGCHEAVVDGDSILGLRPAAA